MDTFHRAKDQLVTIHFSNGETREVAKGSVYLYENGMLKISTDEQKEYHLPHTVNQVVFQASEKTDKSKRGKIFTA